MYSHQDWTPVVFHSKNAKQQTHNKTNDTKTTLSSKQNTIVSIKKLDDNPEVFSHKKIPKELADAVQDKRIELKMTQQALAQRINEKTNVIQDIESAKGVYNHVTINKTLKTLGLTLKEILKN